MTHPNPLLQSAPLRTAHQIVDAQGNAYQTTITSNLWISDPGRFADPTEGNRVQAFVTGKAYFADLLKEIATAKSQILIAGWQVNWDALLAPGVRLYDALYRAAEKNPALKIHVMPWDDREPVQTYDDQTAAALQVINQRLGRRQVLVQLSPSYATKDPGYYSHHQKQVVIDGCIAYVGGIDLAYGRYCDEHYTLKADTDGRQGLNRYNPCVAQVGDMPQHLCADPDLLSGVVDRLDLAAVKFPHAEARPDLPSNAAATAQKIHAGAWQPKYVPADDISVLATDASKLARNPVDPTTLDPARQPRMPWQDVMCRIEGPAVADLMRNFIDRWNIEGGTRQRLDPPPAAASMPQPGNALVQVLRSAPANQCGREYAAQRYKTDRPLPAGTQTDIMSAMLRLIEKSRRFIYIENQFFVSDFGKEVRPEKLSPAAQYISSYGGKNQSSTARTLASISDEAEWRIPDRKAWTVRNSATAIHPPTNRIVGELLARIKRSALSGFPFHVYITLPVHPEGCLCDAAVATQVYWTMQTISFGTFSLLNGIRRIIKGRELLKAKNPDFKRAFLEDNNEYEDVPLEACNEFVTLLNLRNWAKLDERYVTEQIYVHSKVMIVYDLYALVGSANINDRSLLGERDSELAVLVMDGDTIRANVNGDGSNSIVRKFAHELRVNLWRKMFGFLDGKNAAKELEQAIMQPGNSANWKCIQQRARQNASLYEKAFMCVPGKVLIASAQTKADHASILPTWNTNLPAPTNASWKEIGGNIQSPLPFQPDFWRAPSHTPRIGDLINNGRGFFALLPIQWTKNENVRFEFPSALVADNGRLEAVGGNASAAGTKI
jgi:phospholipase D1/2